MKGISMNEGMLKANGFSNLQFAIGRKKDSRLSRLSRVEEEKGSPQGFVEPWQTPIGSSMSVTKMYFNVYLN